MNSKIKLLAEQAGIQEDLVDHLKDEVEVLTYIARPQDIERFAELIVRKCIESTLSLHDAAVKFNWGTEETFHVIVDTIAEDLDMQHIFRS